LKRLHSFPLHPYTVRLSAHGEALTHARALGRETLLQYWLPYTLTHARALGRETLLQYWLPYTPVFLQSIINYIEAV
jgi:hypothetical protein